MQLLSTKKRNMISKFDHRKLALSMSSTNVRENRYHLISLILTLEQNILITITSWQFQLMPCTFFHLVLKCLLPVALIGLCFTFWVSKGGIHSRMSFLLPLLLFPITQRIFLPKFLARIRSWKPYLTFIYSYKQVLGLLQVGRSTCWILLKPLSTYT